MSKIQIALYKGPPVDDLVKSITHYAIRFRTWSKYSHAELVIDGWSYSSSVRDKGVRRKQIEFDPERWDVFEIDPKRVNLDYALAFFLRYEGSEYDWWNIVRYVLPFVPQRHNQFVCFEFVAAMLNAPGYYRVDGDDLLEWAQANRLVVIQDEDYK